MTGPLSPRNRLFVALDLPGDVRTALSDCALRLAGALGGRPVPADRLHLTLRFMGQVDPSCGPELLEAIAALGGRTAPRARLGELRARPVRRQARLVAIEIEDPDGAILALHDALAGALACVDGITQAQERAPWPHVTLVRFGRPSRLPPLPECGDERVFAFSRASLYDSRPSPSGAPSYVALATAALGDGDDSTP